MQAGLWSSWGSIVHAMLYAPPRRASCLMDLFVRSLEAAWQAVSESQAIQQVYPNRTCVLCCAVSLHRVGETSPAELGKACSTRSSREAGSPSATTASADQKDRCVASSHDEQHCVLNAVAVVHALGPCARLPRCACTFGMVRHIVGCNRARSCHGPAAVVVLRVAGLHTLVWGLMYMCRWSSCMAQCMPMM